MKLTVKQIDSSKPKEKDYKLSDGGGLYLLVKTNPFLICVTLGC